MARLDYILIYIYTLLRVETWKIHNSATKTGVERSYNIVKKHDNPEIGAKVKCSFTISKRKLPVCHRSSTVH